MIFLAPTVEKPPVPFCIYENHSLNEWFKKAYGDE